MALLKPKKEEKMVKRIMRDCPVCKYKRKFIRVVEAHEEHHIPDNPRMEVRYPSAIKETSLPIAFCAVCKTVIYVGP